MCHPNLELLKNFLFECFVTGPSRGKRPKNIHLGQRLVQNKISGVAWTSTSLSTHDSLLGAVQASIMMLWPIFCGQRSKDAKSRVLVGRNALGPGQTCAMFIFDQQ
jgi:hypothetical protein